MDAVFYSKSTGGFYDTLIHGNNSMPSDVLEITANQRDELLKGQSQGKLIIADENGYPTLADHPSPTAADVWAKIKLERDRRTDVGGFNVGGNWFHSDQKSRNQQLGLVLMGSNIPAGLQWKTMGGSFVTMTRVLAGQILAAGAASDTAIFAAAEAHKVALETYENPADYDYTTGWPKIFGE